MKKLLLALGFLAGNLLSAQSITDVQSLIEVVKSPVSVIATVTATAGDGSSVVISKVGGGSIVALFSEVSGDGKTVERSGILRTSGITLQTFLVSYSDVVCLVAINPTAAAITAGSLGSIPANGLGGACSVNTRTSGTVTGQTAVPITAVVWP